MGSNMMKHITFGPCHESNHGSAPQPKQTVHQKYKSIKDIDSSDEDILTTRTRKQKKSIAKISGGNSSSFNRKWEPPDEKDDLHSSKWTATDTLLEIF